MTRDFNRRDVLKGASTAGVLSLAGCIGDGGVGDGDGDGTFEAEVGILMPDTGDLGTLGTAIGDAAQLAADHINDAGVDVTVSTQREDTQTDPQAGISGAEALVGAGVPAVVGPAASNVNLQVTRQVFIPNEVVGMSPSSTAPEVTELDDNDFIFRTAPSDALQGPVMANVAVDRLGAETSATIFLNDDYGQALEQAYIDAFQERGGEITDRVPLEPEQPSYTSNWDEALANDPDVVMVVAFPVSGAQLFIDYYEDFEGEHPDLDILVPDGLIDNELPEEVDNDFEEWTGTAPATAGPGAEFFSSAYEDAYDQKPVPFNAHAYDAMAVCALAQAFAQSNDGADVRDNIREVANPPGEPISPASLPEGVQLAFEGRAVNYEGASSAVDFDENGDMSAVSYDILEVQDRDFVSVERIDFG